MGHGLRGSLGPIVPLLRVGHQLVTSSQDLAVGTARAPIRRRRRHLVWTALGRQQKRNHVTIWTIYVQVKN